MHGAGIGDAAVRLQIAELDALHQFQQGFGFIQVVDDGRGAHAQHAQVGILLAGRREQTADDLPPLAGDFGRALFDALNFIQHHKIDLMLFDQPPHHRRRIGLLKRLEIQDEIGVFACDQREPRRVL